MKHRIRINGEIKEIDCELGSDILDKHGREIFEGDRVKFDNQRTPRGNRASDQTGVVVFDDVVFCVQFKGNDGLNYAVDLNDNYWCENLEIVGHVED